MIKSILSSDHRRPGIRPMADEICLCHGKLRRHKIFQKLPDSLRAFFPFQFCEGSQKNAADFPEGTELFQLAEISQKLGLIPAVSLKKKDVSGKIREVFRSGQLKEATDVSSNQDS